MTANEKRANIVKLAQSYIGCGNGDAKHKEILSTYNNFVKNPKYTYNPAPRTHQMTVSEAWCATFVSAIGILADEKNYPCECSCGNQLKQLKNMKEWEENDSYKPSNADIIYYDWEDDGKGDNTGAPNHVGIVEKVSGSTITVIEGNKSNKCARRTISVNGKYIRGFGKIAFKDDVVATTPAAPQKPADAEIPPKPVFKAYTAKVTPSNGLNVRADAGTGYKKLGALSCGTKITVKAEKSGWGKIDFKGKVGWVCLTYVKKV